MTTDNYKKHTHSNPVQRFLIGKFYESLLTDIKRFNPESILDVGCGEGFTLEKFQKAGIGKKLTGIDFLDTAIKIGKKERPDLDLRIGNIYDIPFKSNTFDLVNCNEVLEHIDDPEKGLKELVRVSKKYVVLSVPNEPWFMMANFVRGKNLSRWGNDIEHINHWSTNSFIKFVSPYLKVKSVRRQFPWTLLVGTKK